MESTGELESVTEEELDELLAEDADMSVEELRDRSSVQFSHPWESDITADHEDQ